MLPEDDLTFVAVLRNLVDAKWCGFIPKAPLFGSTAPALRRNYISRIMASFACRISRIPRPGNYGDLDKIARLAKVAVALQASTS